jgi:hypothetical protein
MVNNTISQCIEGMRLNETMFNETLHSVFDTVGITMLSMFYPGFNLGFILLIGFSIALHEHPATPMLGIFAAYIGGYLWMNNYSIWSVLFTYWLNIILYAAGYMIIGAAWTVPKWWIYVRKSKNFSTLQSQYVDGLNKRGRNTVISDADRYNMALYIVGQHK